MDQNTIVDLIISKSDKEKE